MRISRAFAATAAAGILTVGFGIVGASPANAVAPPVTCDTLGIQQITGSGPLQVSEGINFQPGDTLTATNAGAVSSGSPHIELTVAPNLTVVKVTGPAPGSVSYTFTSTGNSPTILVSIVGSGISDYGTTTLTCARTDPAPPIPDWVQAYGRAGADADCPAGYNPTWAGGPSADVVSYQESWQQWMNDGQGGWVCTRNVPSLG